MTDAPRYTRKKLYIKPGFQKKMMIIMILLVTIAANLVGGLCFGLITQTLESEFLASPELRITDTAQFPLLKQKIFEYIFPKILIAEFLTVLLLLFLTLRLTHYIAGPVYRLEKNMQEMARGNLELKTVLRSKDEFTELADALNELAESYQGRLLRLDEKIDLLEYSELSPEQTKVLKEVKTLLSLSPTEESKRLFKSPENLDSEVQAGA
jgi:methyl-accepting chemotaxis protein